MFFCLSKKYNKKKRRKKTHLSLSLSLNSPTLPLSSSFSPHSPLSLSTRPWSHNHHHHLYISPSLRRPRREEKGTTLIVIPLSRQVTCSSLRLHLRSTIWNEPSLKHKHVRLKPALSGLLEASPSRCAPLAKSPLHKKPTTIILHGLQCILKNW